MCPVTAATRTSKNGGLLVTSLPSSATRGMEAMSKLLSRDSGPIAHPPWRASNGATAPLGHLAQQTLLRKTVTHVPGLICHPCAGPFKHGPAAAGYNRAPRARSGGLSVEPALDPVGSLPDPHGHGGDLPRARGAVAETGRAAGGSGRETSRTG